MELIKRCKFFVELDEILGDKPHFNPPYIHHSDNVKFDDERSTKSLETETGDDNTSLDNTSFVENIENIPIIEMSATTSTTPTTPTSTLTVKPANKKL